MLRVASRAMAAAFALALPGLAHAGDFGRPSPSLLDGLIPKQFWKGPVTGQSSFPLTDLEEQLRDRSYALIRPNEPRGSWNLFIAGFQLAHLFPPDIARYDHTEYARMLLWTPSRSEASLYNRLIEDMAADGQLIGPFVAVACAVADLDLKRERSLLYVGELSKDEVGNAIGRIRENRLVTAWVQRALHWRLASYRYALERFVIAVPSGLAVEAERALARFERIVIEADAPLARCASAQIIAALPPARAIVTK
ncbi:MAG TPA: hypothetical protein VJT13_27785 [Xanthobacteraceae bacterium]|nr:hypothetical protein [Xanthobacteraceae bacterium]